MAATSTTPAIEPLGDFLHVDQLRIREPRAELFDPRERRGVPGRVHELYIPGATTPPISANDRGAGDSREGKARVPAYVIRNRKEEAVSRVVGQAIKAAGWPIITGVVEVGLVYYLRNNGWADPDNIAPTIKPCIDAMKPPKKGRQWGAGILDEDHHGVVRRTWQEVVPGGRNGQDPHPELGPRLWLLVIEVQ